MKKHKEFILGFLCAVILTSTAVMANSGFTAYISSQLFHWNDKQIVLDAYNINGYNYVKLRDIAKVFGVNVEYNESSDSVYLGEHLPIEDNIIADKKSDGKAYSREDFSQRTNPDIFNEVYTRDAYNAVKQTLVDAETISADTDKYGYNKSYAYANFVDYGSTIEKSGETVNKIRSVLGVLNGFYTFELGNGADITNMYEYPGYSICMVTVNKKLEPAKAATDMLVSQLKPLSDTEKVKRIADYVSDKIVYKDENTASTAEVFTSSSPVNGICGTYANAFKYLCMRADVPCVTVSDTDHAWNEVYADNEWKTVDVGYYDVGRPQAKLYITNYWKKDGSPDKTKFAKELLVPMSTK